jgi:hypothetical protein
MERGQASLEYVAVIAVVVLVLAAGAAVAGAGAVPKAVAAQVHRAYCLVAGGDCLGDEGPRPCTVRTRGGASERRVKAWLAKLADGRSVLTEEHSDGTATVTLLDLGEALGGPRLPKGLEGRLGGRLTAGRRWSLPDAAAARRLVAQLDDEDRLPAGEVARGAADFLRGEGGADERFVRFGTRGEGSAAFRALGVAEALAGIAGGLRIDRATGRRTVEVIADRAAAAGLSEAFATIAGGIEREMTIEAAFARDGTPLELTVRRGADVHGQMRLGPLADAKGGNRAEVEARLDLTDPRARALATTFLDRARHADPDALSAAADLGRHLVRNARLDVRLYATTHDERTKGVVIETTTTAETARLLEAYGRDPLTGWSRRHDCLGVA